MFAFKTTAGSAAIVPSDASAARPMVSGMALTWPCSNKMTNGSMVIEVGDLGSTTVRV